MKHYNDYLKIENEKGAALIVALVMLLLMAIIGVTAMQGVTLQEKMTGNMRDNQTALFAGEVALDYVETWVNVQTKNPDNVSYDDCGANCPVIATGTSDSDPTNDGLLGNSSAVATWEQNSVTFGDDALDDLSATDIDGVVAQPNFLMEFMLPANTAAPSDFFNGTGIDTSSLSCTKPDTFNTGENDARYDYCYRITTRASGASEQSRVILQTEYIKRFN